MDTTLKPQLTDKNETKMKPQSDKEIKMNTKSDKNQKPKIIIIFLVMLFLLAGGGLLAATRFGDEVIGPAIMFLFALCFSAIAAWSRKNQWAIIPAGIFASIGLVVTLEFLLPESEAIGLCFMFLLTATFLVFAILSKKNWWAIIPSGLFASLGLVVALEILIPYEEYPRFHGLIIWGFYSWALFLGLAATFGTLWLLRKSMPTRWAVYPVVGFQAVAVLSIIEGAHFSEYWLAMILLVFEAISLLAVLTRKRSTAGSLTPEVKA
jgi:hypothetical protein